MSLPRALSLKKINNEWILIQQPIKAVEELRKEKDDFTNSTSINIHSNVYEADFVFTPSMKGESGIKLFAGNNHELKISYDADKKIMSINRSKTNALFSKKFASINNNSTAVQLHNGKLKWHIYVDNSIVEIFVNDGEQVFTTQIFNDENETGIELFSTEGKIKTEKLIIYSMKSVL